MVTDREIVSLFVHGAVVTDREIVSLFVHGAVVTDREIVSLPVCTLCCGNRQGDSQSLCLYIVLR